MPEPKFRHWKRMALSAFHLHAPDHDGCHHTDDHTGNHAAEDQEGQVVHNHIGFQQQAGHQDLTHIVQHAAGDADGAMSAANILKPLLARGEIQIIGATTIHEYRKYT